MLAKKYEYSFGVRNLPVGQIVNVSRRDISIPNQPWENVGSYFSMYKRIRPGNTFNAGVNATYESIRKRSE